MSTVVVAPHCDDAELGASLYLATGADVVVVAGQDVRRQHEQTLAVELLGGGAVDFGDWPDGYVTQDRSLVAFLEGQCARAQVILSPPANDTHQDHVAVSRAVLSALRRSAVTLLEYETPSVTADWCPNMWLPMNGDDLDRQAAALSCHQSQAHRAYTQPEWLTARAVFRGQQIGVRFAQAYRVVRMTRPICD